MKIKLHKSGEITYFSILLNAWRKSTYVSAEELCTLSLSERSRIIRHMEKHA